MKLVIAEKPSVAKGIYPVIKATTKGNGYYEGNGYIVSWCYGHLVKLLQPDEYCDDWKIKWSFDVLPMIPEKWKFKVSADCKEQFNTLKALMKRDDVTEIICATDADREGECIFRYVYNLIGCRKPVKRLWISSLEEDAVEKGFKELKDGSEYDSLFQAGFARAKADWLVGMNDSRLFSVRYSERLSIGRVQTPTLAMVVKRDYEVENFVKQKYFTVALNLGSFTADSERINDESQAEELVKLVTGKKAVISSLKKEIKTVNPPKLYDLTTLQRDANKWFGYTAKQTLDALQKLYEAKLATYPRTDSQYISDDMEQTAVNMVDVVKEKFPKFTNGQEQTVNVARCINNSKVTGHHAILPTEKIKDADITLLTDEQRNILMLISARLLLATAETHKYESVKVIVKCENNDFTANGKTVLENGWKLYEETVKNAIKSSNSDSDEKEKEEKKLPELTDGQTFENVKAEKIEHWTSPPKYYTEDTLLSAMEHAGNDEYDDDTEKKGLGTPATRATIIEGLVIREYVVRKGKQIISTEKGRKLINVVPEIVKSPKLTAEWETQLQQIERGKYSEKEFMTNIINSVKQHCQEYGEMDTSVDFKKPQESLGQCPKCKSEVKKGKFGVYCTAKCGMNIGKVYGKELTETQIQKLLNGKQISYTANSKKTIVLPEVVQNDYNGKTYFQWKTKKG